MRNIALVDKTSRFEKKSFTLAPHSNINKSFGEL